MTDQPDLSHITEDLRALATPIDALHEDPANANIHGERSLRSIMGSFARYGQRKPFVVNKNGNIVQAGNGGLEAARRLGWTHVAAVFVEDDPLTHTGFAIADNRTAQLSHWDEDALVQLLEQIKKAEPDAPAADMWDDIEWETLMDNIGALDEDAGPPDLDDLADAFGGDPDPADFWPFVHVKLPPDVHGRYEDLMSLAPGDDESERFAALLAAVDELALGVGA